jgi:hypothetical protein
MEKINHLRFCSRAKLLRWNFDMITIKQGEAMKAESGHNVGAVAWMTERMLGLIKGSAPLPNMLVRAEEYCQRNAQDHLSARMPLGWSRWPARMIALHLKDCAKIGEL